ncbi:MAG TPA: DUF4214 domain-containing protein [Pirellulales bacterium]|nr:DUF4214 domain-containing protein [Pirellulales bacterium]
MCQDLLGWPADADGQSWWTNALAQGASRASVAFGFTDSLERAEQLIAEDYQHYLGRPADPNGLAYFAAQFNHGWTNEEIITGFLDGDEYYNQHTNA